MELCDWGLKGFSFPPTRLWGAHESHLVLLRLLIPFCSDKADGAELKTRITQNNPKPGEDGEGGAYP